MKTNNTVPSCRWQKDIFTFSETQPLLFHSTACCAEDREGFTSGQKVAADLCFISLEGPSASEREKRKERVKF